MATLATYFQDANVTDMPANASRVPDKGRPNDSYVVANTIQWARIVKSACRFSMTGRGKLPPRRTQMNAKVSIMLGFCAVQRYCYCFQLATATTSPADAYSMPICTTEPEVVAVVSIVKEIRMAIIANGVWMIIGVGLANMFARPAIAMHKVSASELKRLYKGRKTSPLFFQDRLRSNATIKVNVRANLALEDNSAIGACQDFTHSLAKDAGMFW